MSENIARYNAVLELITQVDGASKAKKELTGLEKQFTQLRKRIIGVFAVNEIAKFTKQIFDTTAKYQQYNTILTNSLQSQEEAAKAFALIKDVAKDSVFSVDELTASYIKFINRGVKPTRDQIISLTDLAASQGKSFDQLVEAALDAQTGEFERLKEFGIKAKKEGDLVALSFKGQTVEVQNTSEAINAALVSFGQLPGVLGSNAVQMETLNGRVSRIKDQFDELKVTIGNVLLPVFNLLLGAIAGTIGFFVQFFDIITKLPKFIKDNRAAFISLGLAIVTFNAGLIAANAQMIFWNGAILIASARQKALAVSTRILAVAQKALNLIMRANPIGLVVTAAFALVSVFLLLSKRSAALRNIISGLTRVFTDFKDFLVDFSNNIVDVFSDGFAKGIERLFGSIKLYIRREFGTLIEGFSDIASGNLSAGLKKIGTTLLKNNPITGPMYAVGSAAAKSFNNGFQDNVLKETVEGLLQGNRGGDRRGGFAELAKRRKEREEQNKKDLESAKANAKKREDLRKKELESQLESARKEFLQREIDAKNQIDDAKKLSETLQFIEVQRQIRFREIKQRFASGSEFLELESELISLGKSFENFYSDLALKAIEAPVDEKVRAKFQEESKKLFDLLNSDLSPDLDASDGSVENLKFLEDSVKKSNTQIFELRRQLARDLLSTDKKNVRERELLQEDANKKILELEIQKNEALKAIALQDGDIERFQELSLLILKLKLELSDLGVNVPSNTSFLSRILGLDDETLKLVKEQSAAIYEEATNLASQLFSLEQEKLDKEIELQETRVEAAQKIAETGNLKQLRIEKERLDDLLKEREDAANRAAAIQKAATQAEIILNTARTISNIQAGAAKTFAQTGVAASVALPITLAVFAGLLATASNIFTPPSFMHGTEHVASDPRYNKYRNRNSAETHRADFNGTERIVDGQTNKQLNGFPNKELPQAVRYYQRMKSHLKGNTTVDGLDYRYSNSYDLLPAMSAYKLSSISGGSTDTTALQSKMDEMITAFEQSSTKVNIDKQGIMVIVDRYVKERLDRQKFMA